MRKINILVICLDTVGGVGFYRCLQPHMQLQKQFPDDFNVTIENRPNFSNLEKFKEYDIIFFNKGLFINHQNEFFNLLNFCKENNIITIADIDDYWDLNTRHGGYIMSVKRKDSENIRKSLSMSDYVTTTTSIFADSIKKINENVKVFPNAIDPTDKRFQINKKPCDKIRIGMVMGSSHLYDVQTMEGFVSKLPKEILDKVVFVLCGFDIRGKISTINPYNGQVSEREIQPEETAWFQYEKIITNNYKNLTPIYKNFLLSFIPNAEFPTAIDEGYLRKWTKPIDSYYQHYNDVDVLLAPLEENTFNKHKSELKAIECAFSHTAFIGSNFGPYTIGLKNLFQKGGGINEDGNAILVDRNKAHKDWAKSIEKLVKNPNLIKILQDNLYNDFKDKYDLRNITNERCKFYKKITENKIK